MKQEDKGTTLIEDFLKYKNTMGLRAAIIDEGSKFKSSSPPITQQQFEEIFNAVTEKTSFPDFIIGTQAGLFKQDKHGDWFVLMTGEDNIRGGLEQNWKRCLSPFLDETGKTRSEIIFLK